MGAYSRNKGARGERMAAAALRGKLGIDVQRSARNGVDNAGDLWGLPGYSVEVKYGYAGSGPAMKATWWDQALEAGRGANATPMLMYRSPNVMEWTVRVPAYCLIKHELMSEPESRWIEMSLDTFAAMYQET
jgi:hypothetical protein